MLALRQAVSLLFCGLLTSVWASPARADESVVSTEPAPGAAEPAPRRNVSFGGELMVLPTQRETRASVFGVGASVSFALGSGFSLGPSLALLHVERSGEGATKTLTTIRPGARLAWGSDNEDGIFAVSLDLGSWVGFGGYQAVTLLPYLQPSFVMQFPKGATRPYLAVNGMVGFGEPDELTRHPSEAFGPFGIGLAMGVSWSAL